MEWNIILYVFIFLIPGILILLFSRKMVEYNARSYPRIYTPLMRKFTLLLFLCGGILLIFVGFVDLILKPLLQP